MKSYQSKTVVKRSQRQPSDQQVEYQQKLEALTNQYHKDLKNAQEQLKYDQLQPLHMKYLQDYGEYSKAKSNSRVLEVLELKI